MMSTTIKPGLFAPECVATIDIKQALEGLEEPKEPEEPIAVPPSPTRTSLPNWLMPIICMIFITLLGFVYATVDNRITDVRNGYKEDINELKRRLETQETFMKNTREMLIRYGWDISDDGKITRRTKEK